MGISKEIPSGITVRSECGVAGEGRLVGEQDFHSLGRFTMAHGTNKYVLRLDGHCSFITWIFCFFSFVFFRG